MSSLATCPIRYKALILDCDGVLVDSEPLHWQSWREVFLRHGVALSDDYMMRFVGMSSPQTMAALVELEHAFENLDPEELIRQKRELFWEYVDDRLEEIPGVSGFLNAMARRVPLAMATGGPRATYHRVLRRMKWTDLFQVTVGADDIVNSKPHPEIYALTLERLGLPASACLAFEDSAPGLEAARAAGLDVVGIASTYPPEYLAGRGACAIMRDFTDEDALCAALGDRH